MSAASTFDPLYTRVLTLNTNKSTAVLDTLFSLASTKSLHLICIQEPPHTPYHQPGWTLLANATPNSHYRAATYVNSKLDPQSYSHALVPDGSGDIVICDVKTGAGQLRVVNVYNTVNRHDSVPKLPPHIQPSASYPLLLAMGDFNLHHPAWNPTYKPTPTSAASKALATFHEADLGLLLEPGTVTFSRANSCLDLVLGNEATQAKVVSCKVDLDFDALSDHLPIVTTISTAPSTRAKAPSYRWKRLSAQAAQEAYAALAPRRLNSLASRPDIDKEVEDLSNNLRAVRDQVVPLDFASEKFSKPWWTPACTEAVKSASNARNRASRLNTPTHIAAQQLAFQRKKAVLRRAERQYEKAQLESVGPSTLWDRVRAQLTSSEPTSVPTLVRPDGSLASSHEAKVNVFQEVWFGETKISAPASEADSSRSPRQNSNQLPGCVLGMGSPLTPPFNPVRSISPRTAPDKIDRSPKRLSPASPSSEEVDPSCNAVAPARSSSCTGRCEVNRRSSCGTEKDNVLEERKVVSVSARPDNERSCSASALSSTCPVGGGIGCRCPQSPPTHAVRPSLPRTASPGESRRSPPPASPAPPTPTTRPPTSTYIEDVVDKYFTSLPASFVEVEGDEWSGGEQEAPAPSFNFSPKSPTADSPPQPPLEAFPRQRWHHTTEQEIKSLFFDGKISNAKGTDQLPNSLIVALWPVLGSRIVRLYCACLRLGYHPTAWKEALALALRKPHKSDYSLANAYRPISLLAALGKGLEKLVARRISFMAESSGLLPSHHFGGRPGRSCDDAVGVIVDEIHQRWRQGEVAAGFLLDVKSAFPSVQCTKLVSNLRRRGLPDEVLAFVTTFMEDRSVRLLLDGVESPKLDISNGGLPQGSPLSPILFLFYNANLLDALQTQSSLAVGWIDDVAVVAWAKDGEELSRRLQSLMGKVEEWSSTHQAAMDPAKSHLITFSRLPAALQLARKLPLQPILLLGTAIPPCSSAVLLGITLDSRLSFRGHVEAAVAKRSRAIGGLARLASSKKGISFEFARQLTVACVLTKTDFGSQLWFKPGSSTGLVAILEKVQRSAARFITGGFRSAGVKALGFESFLLPTDLRLARLAQRSAARWLSLPKTHPLSPRVTRALAAPSLPFPSHLHTLTHAFASISATSPMETISPAPIAPWDPFRLPPVTIASSKEDAVRQHDKLMTMCEEADLMVYCDGSLMEGRAGAGVAMRRGGESGEWWEKAIALGERKTVYLGEVIGINTGLQLILDFVQLTDTTPASATILVDNQAALRSLASGTASSGQSSRLTTRHLISSINLAHPSISLRFQWVPGHAEVEGNEFADAKAKEGASFTEGMLGVVDKRAEESMVSAVVQEGSKAMFDEWTRWWKEEERGIPGRIKKVDGGGPGRRLLKLHKNLNRRHDSILTQLRTSRSHLNADLFEIGVAPSPLCPCGRAAETRAHYFLSCPLYTTPRRALTRASALVGHDNLSLSALLNLPSLIPATLRFINDSDRFPRFFSRLEA